MPEMPLPSSERTRRLERLLADYLHAVEAGIPPDQDELLNRHPDLTDELRSFFRNRDAVQRPTGTLQKQRPPRLEETVGGDEPAQDVVSVGVRYFGDYEILEEIARGGMGVVYRARQLSLPRVVALKMILRGELATPADVRRFQDEAQAAANLDHPHIVPLYEVGAHHGQHYFSMKFMEGGSLAARIPDLVRRPSDGARLLAIVARAVHHAHQRGILHRDLKPGNILLDAQGRPHVTDFGLARRIESDGSRTHSGAIVGTASYMAPEQARAEKGLTTAADVHGLGAVLYELLTGRPPFLGATTLETVLQVLECEPVRPRALRPGIDRDLETVCLKCLEKRPERRYRSAEALAEELERWQEGRPIQARPAGPLECVLKWMRRRPAVAALLGVVLAVVLLGLIAFGWQYQETVAQKQVAQEQARLKDEEARLKDKARDEAEQRTREARAAEAEAKGKGEETLRSLGNLRRTLFTAQVVRADAVAAKDSEQARTLLEDEEACPPELRDFPWGQLYARCLRGKKVVAEEDHPFVSFTLSGDGRTVLTADRGGSSGSWRYRVWDLAAGKLKQQLKDRPFLNFSGRPEELSESWYQEVAWLLSPEGTRAFAIWYRDLKRIVEFPTSGEAPRSAAELPPTATGPGAKADRGRLACNGPWLAVAGDDRAQIWQMGPEGLKEHAVCRLPARAGRGHGWLALSPQGNFLALYVPHGNFASQGNLVTVEVAGGKERGRFELSGAWSLSAITFAGDGESLFVADGPCVCRRDPTTGKILETLEPAGAPVQFLQLSPDGKTLAGGPSRGASQPITIWDTTSGRVRLVLRGARAPFAFASNDSLMTLDPEGALVRWDLRPTPHLVRDAGGLSEQEMEERFGQFKALDLSPDLRLTALAGQGYAARFPDLRTGKEQVVRGIPDNAELLFSTEGRLLASSDGAGKLRLQASGGEINNVAGAYALSPGGGSCVVEVGTRITKRYGHAFQVLGLTLWNMGEGKEVARFADARGPVTFSPDGRFFAAAEVDGETLFAGESHYREPIRVKVWETATGKLLATREGATIPLLFSPDGGALAVQTAERVTLWDVREDKVRFPLVGLRLPLGDGNGVRSWPDVRGSFSVPSPGADRKSPVVTAPWRERTILNLAFSPDGKQLACFQGAGEIVLRDSATGKILKRLRGASDTMTALVYSGDGKTLAAGDNFGVVHVWDLPTERLRHTLHARQSAPLQLAFMANDRLLVSDSGRWRGNSDRQLWNLETGRELVLAIQGSKAVAAALAPDGRIVATAVGKDVFLWDLPGGKMRARLTGHEGEVITLQFANDGRRLHSSSYRGREGREELSWNIPEGKLLSIQTTSALPMAVSQDGRTLLEYEGSTLTFRDLLSGALRGRVEQAFGTPAEDPTGKLFAVPTRAAAGKDAPSAVTLFDVGRGGTVRTLADLQGPMRFSPDGSLLAGHVGRDLAVIDVATGKERNRLAGGHALVAFSPDGKTLLLNESNTRLTLWVIDAEARPLDGCLAPAEFTPDGKTLAAVGTERGIVLVEVATGQRQAVLEGPPGRVAALRISPNGKFLCAIHGKSDVCLWDLAQRRQHLRETFPYTIDFFSVITFAPDSKRCYLGNSHHYLHGVDAETGKALTNLHVLGGLRGISPDGSLLLAGSMGNMLCDLSTGKPRLEVPLGSSGIQLTSDRKHISISGEHPYPFVRVLDAATGVTQVEYRHFSAGRSFGTTLSPDGRVILVRGEDSTTNLGLWDPATGRERGQVPVSERENAAREELVMIDGPVSPDGRHVVCVENAGYKGTHVFLHDVFSRRASLVYRHEPRRGWLHAYFSPDSTVLNVLTETAHVQVQLATGRQITTPRRFLAQELLEATALDAAGGRLACLRPLPGTPRCEVQLLDLATGTARILTTLAEPAQGLGFSPDRKKLGYLTHHSVGVLDVESGQELFASSWGQYGHGLRKEIVFNPDGKILVTVRGGAAHRWDLVGKRELPAWNGIEGQVSFSADGKTALGRTADGLEVRDAGTGRVLASLPAEPLGFAPDGKVLVGWKGVGPALWNREANTLRLLAEDHLPGPATLTFSPDGSLLVGTHPLKNSRNMVLISRINSRTGHCEPDWYWGSGNIHTAFSPDGKTLAIASDGSALLHLRDLASAKQRTLPQGHAGGIGAVAFHPQGLLVTGGTDTSIRMWNIQEGKEVGILPGHGKELVHLAFTPDGRTLVSLAGNLTPSNVFDNRPGSLEIKRWDLETRKEKAGFSLEGVAKGFSFALAPDGLALAVFLNESVVLGKAEKGLALWDLATGAKRWTRQVDARTLFFTPDGKRLVLLPRSFANKPQMLDASTGEPVDALFAPGSNGQYQAGAFDPTGTSFVLAGPFYTGSKRSSPVQLWRFDARTGKPLGEIESRDLDGPAVLHREMPFAFAWQPDSRAFASRCYQQINLWEVRGEGDRLDARPVRTLRARTTAERLFDMAYRPDGKRLGAVSSTCAYVWDTETGRLRIAVPLHSDSLGAGYGPRVAFGPEGSALVVALENGDLLFHDDNTGALRSTCKGHSSRMKHLEFSADGRYLMSHCLKGEVRLWSVPEGKLLRLLDAQTEPVQFLGFTDGMQTALGLSRIDNQNPKEPLRFARFDFATGKPAGEPISLGLDQTPSQDGRLLVTVSRQSGLSVVDRKSGEEKFRLSTGNATTAQFSPAGTKLAVLGEDGELVVLDTTTGRQARMPTRPEFDHSPRTFTRSPPIAFSGDGGRLATVLYRFDTPPVYPEYLVARTPSRGHVRVLDVEGKAELCSIPHDVPDLSLALNGDGTVLATGGLRAVRLWEAATGKPLREIALPGWEILHVLGFVAGDQLLAIRPALKQPGVGQPNEDVVLWDLAGNRVRTTLRDTGGAFAASPRGRTLATSGQAPGAQLWDASTGQARGTVPVEVSGQGQVSRLLFGTDGQSLLASLDKATLRWDSTFPDPIQQRVEKAALQIRSARRQLRGASPGDTWHRERGMVELKQALETLVEILRRQPDQAGALQSLHTLIEEVAFHREVGLARAPGDATPLALALAELIQPLLDRKPEHPHLLYSRGRLLHRIRPDEALALYRRSVGRLSLPEAHIALGDLLEGQGDFDGALGEYRQALAADPASRVAAQAAAELLLETGGNPSSLLPFLEKAAAAAPRDGGLVLLLARTQERAGRWEQALASLRMLPPLALGVDKEPGRLKARILERLGRWTEAAAAWPEGYNGQCLAPDTLRVAYDFRRAGKVGPALTLYRAAGLNTSWLKASPRWPELEKQLADVRAGKGTLSPEDRIVLARACAFDLRTVTALRLYREALTARPALAEEARYAAACAAVLASAGVGAEALSLNEEARSRYRREALGWLRQELALVGKELADHPGDAFAFVGRLASWEEERDLEGVRSPRVPLPAKERDDWEQFWSEVKALRRQALACPAGRWRIEGQELIQEDRTTGPAILPFGSPLWSDYTVELEARCEPGGNNSLGVGLRRGSEEFYRFYLGGPANQFAVFQRFEEGRFSRPENYTNGALEPGQWYRIRLVIEGNRAAVQVDGKELPGENLKGCRRGGAALISWGSANRFRNIRVTDPAGRVLFQGLPPLPETREP